MAICAANEWQENVSYSIEPDSLLKGMDLTCKGFVFNILYSDSSECAGLIERLGYIYVSTAV